MKIGSIFNAPVNEVVFNHKTEEACRLVSCVDTEEIGSADIDKIVAICNQVSVYEMLFRDKFEGEEYDREKASGFVQWAHNGWKNQEYFVFLIRRGGGEIVGALDIKSNDLARGEVGYWADENNPGVMTNALAKLIELSKDVGYKKLFALVREDNQKSQNVLIRNGFVFTKDVLKTEGKRMVFEKEL